MKPRKKELRSAAALVRQSMLSHSAPAEESAAFSKDFTQRIPSLDRLAQRRASFVQARRSIVAVLLLLLIGGGVFVTTSPKARAAVREWVREIYEHSVVYRFTSKPRSAELPRFSPTWLPDGMELVETIEMNAHYIGFYSDSDGHDLSIDSFFADESSSIMYDNLDGSAIQAEEITIHGFLGYYIPPDEYGQSNLFWVEDGVTVSLDGTLKRSDMLHIAESLILVKTEK